jgi:lipoyl(octanoyl) transferase
MQRRAAWTPHSDDIAARCCEDDGVTSGAELWCVRLGLVPYARARELQRRLEAARQADEVPDVLLLLEHPPVYTRGRRSEAAELPMGVDWYRRQGIEVCETDRGGRVTYHGPGQLVGYPIVSLRPYDDDVHAYIRRLEEVMIASLAEHGVEAQTIDGLTGVWTRQRRKIGAIGIHVSRGVTTHGFAINVSNDLQPFEWIVPCGLEGCRVSSLTAEVGRRQEVDSFAATVMAQFGRVYDRRPLEVDGDELVRRVPPLEGLGLGATVGAPA